MLDDDFMRLALEQAAQARQEDEVPVGAVLVKNGEVIATGFNGVIGSHDPTAHAEIVALRKAGQLMQNYRLPDCELFVTLEPCAMCASAMIHARIKRVVFGANDPKTGAAGGLLNVFETSFNHQTQVQGGVLDKECSVLLREFFKTKRQQSKG